MPATTHLPTICQRQCKNLKYHRYLYRRINAAGTDTRVPETTLIRLDKRLVSLMKKTSPEMLIQQLHKVIGDDKKIMSAMMQNPDLFSALLMLRAADELGIDIDVTVGDVLECFGVDKQTDIFSFPF